MKLHILKTILRQKFQRRHVSHKCTRRQSLKGSYTWAITRNEISALIKEVRNEKN